MHDGCIEVEYHPEYCQQLQEKKAPELLLKDLLPMLKGGGLMFLCHEEAEQSVLVENLCELTDAGQEDIDITPIDTPFEYVKDLVNVSAIRLAGTNHQLLQNYFGRFIDFFQILR